MDTKNYIIDYLQTIKHKCVCFFMQMFLIFLFVPIF